ncbi:hypothetical protein AGOR_G00212160 [Albula goreensis]|uniref:Ig-like domain-containing protein n=1 Tax=Albula goreensis TaxID=1534307 RepID=A0A8T3CR29_9TELE|nr:hypothetical protein AGOR_G00212160 [Albula goreensis]
MTLTCEITGAVSSIHWLKDGHALVPDNRTAFSPDNSSVTLSHVQRSDDGNYQCEALNAVSSKTSPGYHLLVNYGPEQVLITGPAVAETGTKVTFSCSASSQPPSQYRWYFNGSQVGEGSVFETGPLTLASHGSYTCEASNSVTGRNSTAVKELAVVAPISSVTVIPYPSIPILASNLTLTCNVTGVFKTMYWLKDGQSLTSKDNVIVNADNSSVSFVPAQLTDDGSYQCFASNLHSEKSSPVYHLLVSYGPDSVEIKGPHKVKAGTPVKLTCSAQSRPPSHFSWSFKGSGTMATGNILNLAKPSAEDSGLYTCLGENPLTKVTAMATFNLTIESFAVPVMLSREGLPLTALTGLSVLLLTNWLSY